MDISLFEELWADQQPERSDLADFWNRRAASFNAHSKGAESGAYRRDLIEKLAARAGVDASSAVLDIGCGPGRHALAFAGLAGQVEGFDIAQGMIDCARENAVQAGADNTHFQVLDWAAADIAQLGWSRKFQMVFASRTPAIYSRETLEKMTSASCGSCCLITHVDGRNSVREALAPIAGKDKSREMTRRGAYCAFNILWLLGYSPEVEYLERTWESDSALDDAVLMYTRHFYSVSPLTEDQKTALAAELRKMSRNGRVHEKGYSKMALLFWNVNNTVRQP